jgi:LAGLIDADG DNA endonuclease family
VEPIHGFNRNLINDFYDVCMVNTVGSFIEVNEKWQKKWIGIKQSLFLTPEQHSALVGSILGDGTLRLGEGAINANFKVEQGLVQKDYVFWKYKIFRPWVFTEPKISYRYRESGERYAKSWWFRTVRHPMLTEYHKRFYVNGRKIVPIDIAKDLDGLTLAIWIMDDGSSNRNHLDISTYSFTLSEIDILRDAFKSKFDIHAQCYRDRDKGFRMYFRVGETKKIVDIIKPYIIPTMRYKIRLQ